MAFITVVRGRLNHPDEAAARQLHNDIVDRLRPRSEPMGAAGHQAYGDPMDPGAFLAIDRWSNAEGLQAFLGDPSVQQELGSMFDGQPDVSVWAEREEWRAF